MRKKILAAVLCAALALSFTGCSLFEKSTADNDSKQDGNGSSQNDNTAAGKTILSNDGLFEMMIPEGFKEAKPGELNSDACIEIMNEKKVRFTMCIMEPKDDFDNFDSFVELAEESVKMAYSSGTISDLQTKETNGKSMKYLTVELSESGVKFYVNVYFIETEGNYGQVYVWAAKSSANWVDENAPVLAASVKEVSTQA